MEFLKTKTSGKNVWIGGERTSVYPWRLFQWVDGTKFEYKNWDSRQPDNHDYKSHCIAWGTFGRPGKWHDAACRNAFTYICKKPASGNSFSFKTLLSLFLKRVLFINVGSIHSFQIKSLY